MRPKPQMGANMSIQEALKLLRAELGLSQEDLASKLNKAFVTINRWENGKAFPSRKNSNDIIELAKKSRASDNCLTYLKEILIPDKKRALSATRYGFPEIDKEFLFQLADNSTNSLYVIDAETFDLLYLNRTAEKFSQRDLKRKGKAQQVYVFSKHKKIKCYQFFDQSDKQCSFCPMYRSKDDKFMDTIINIPEIGSKYHVRVKSQMLNNRKVFVVYSTDISELKNESI